MAEEKQYNQIAGEAIRAQGSILRELHAILKEKDAKFGGLVRVQNKRRQFLFYVKIFTPLTL